MKILNKNNIWAIILLLIYSCTSNSPKEQKQIELDKDIELITDFGSVTIRLSDETPIHRDNFIKLVKQGFFDSIQWHRVVDNFLIQTGDPVSKTADINTPIGSDDVGYTLPAEINHTLFHQRGALNAARMGDDVTPERESSGSQFTIIQGMVYNDSLLDIREQRINSMLAYNKALHLPKNKKYLEFLKHSILEEKNADSVLIIQNLLKIDADQISDTMNHYSIPELHREVYKKVGGAAHLDQNYTVFGMVISGMDVVDSIARVQTIPGTPRPQVPVRILNARFVERVK